ncbi:MAG: hypothetical protein HZB68_01490 [Candidatus Aenigmarchaeota archaeon]|nr:hypothetical protein [Candidatus Aenigmarchaeota archaeon]
MATELMAALENVLKSNKKVIMMELPADRYLEAGSASVKVLIDLGYRGVYVSFQRPCSNISSILSRNGIDTKKLVFIDAASPLAEEKKTGNCVYISERVEVDELVRAVYTSLGKLEGKKFIYIDSISTIALYKPLSETMRLSEFLVSTVRKENCTLVFNVAKDLAQKKFVRDIALKADAVIGVAE